MINNMTVVEVKLEIPKETKELIDALAGIISDLFAGKKLEAVTNNLGKLLQAVQGIDDILPELKSKNRDDIAAYLVKVMQEALDKGSKGSESDPEL